MLVKLEQLIFYLFLFSIPFQTRKILYFEGWRFNEWQSISVYGTDILLGVLWVLWALDSIKLRQIRISNIEIRNKFKLSKSKFLNPNTYLLLFLVISAVSIKNSDNLVISWYQWAKLVEFVIFYWYLSHYAFKKFGLLNSFLAIFLSGIFQAIVAISQFLKQSNIGLKYLGESIINNDFSGVASFYISKTEKIIRAYGTTPHPNVLAVSLLLAIFAFYFIYLYSRLHEGEARLEKAARSHSEKPEFSDRWDKFLLVFYGVILFGFFTTFSRTVIFSWFAVSCIMGAIVISSRNYGIIFGTEDGRRRIRSILLVSLCAICLFGSIYFQESISRLTISGEDQAIELRTFYAKEALKTNINLFGIGYGNFMSWLIKENPFLPAHAYQPVHNIFLLIYSETGVLGVSTFLLFLVFLIGGSIKKIAQSPFVICHLLFVIGLLFIGLFDHMFWTLQQGRIIFWLSLALLTFNLKNDIIRGESQYH